MGTVWDVKRPAKQRQLTDDQMIQELWERGVGIERIFGVFYALEEMASHRSDLSFGNDEEGQHGRQPLTVGDAHLAGVVPPIQPNVPLGTPPF